MKSITTVTKEQENRIIILAPFSTCKEVAEMVKADYMAVYRVGQRLGLKFRGEERKGNTHRRKTHIPPVIPDPPKPAFVRPEAVYSNSGISYINWEL